MTGRLIIVFLFGLVSFATGAQQIVEPVISEKSGHIVRISADSIIAITGTTYSFTVDTPEDKGMVITSPTVKEFLSELTVKDKAALSFQVLDRNGKEKIDSSKLETGDELKWTGSGKTKIYKIALQRMALSGSLTLEKDQVTVNTGGKLILYFTAGQRSPEAIVQLVIPQGILITPSNTTINVIGRGDVLLKDLPTQSMGRLGTNYPYHQVGNYSLAKQPDGSTLLTVNGLDLRPANGADLKLVINDIKLPQTGNYVFKASYQTKQPEVLTSPGTGMEIATLKVTRTISDLVRLPDNDSQYIEHAAFFTSARFRWSQSENAPVTLQQSLDDGKTWMPALATVNNNSAKVTNLLHDKLYAFRLYVKDGPHKGYSNTVQFYSGKLDIRKFGVLGNDKEDATDKINEAISYLHSIGGGTLLFDEGIYNVRTVHLKSNVWLYINQKATIKALKGGDAPEATWFSDKKYRSGLSPTDKGPYLNPENWLTKQDVGHHYFYNAMFFGERLDNIKIIGNGRITGDGNLVTGDRVMNNAPDNRADKMFALKLCTNVEIGGIYRPDDLWYEEQKDEPYYIKNGAKDFDISNMLHIDRGGHFVLLATGTDHLKVHDTYFAKNNTSNARDICDFMQCNDVTVTNIYSKVSSDDIIKPGSDCSLGFTRPAKKYRIRNIIGDTNCNLFQIGSETADDITDACIDNIYVLGANKAGFSISTNDGGHVRNIHLNCGHTGKLHSRSKMLRTTTPFFISISNRGRILGADVSRFKFEEQGEKHDELLVTNVNIGEVENIMLNGVDISEVYSGSSYGDTEKRWKPYDGKQKKATPIIAGYTLPESSAVEGGLKFRLPNGHHTGYIKNISFNDIQVLVKGGNPVSDTAAAPPELGVGQYNVSNLKVQPSYGLWARHVKGLALTNSRFNYEQKDGRYAFYLDDVLGARFSNIKAVKASELGTPVGLKKAVDVRMEQILIYTNEWNNEPVTLPLKSKTTVDIHK